MEDKMTDAGQITVLLQRVRQGDRDAESELAPMVYEHLHRLAQREFRSERSGHTLQPTALIGELYMRIIRDCNIDWQSRAHFYTVAASTMRRILVDHARSANAQRRPNPRQRVELDNLVVYSRDRKEEALVVDEALDRLTQWDARAAKVIELRFFAGLSFHETAEVLSISERTVIRDWNMARAWLAALLEQQAAGA